jgi:hypothetical protein
MLEEIAAHTWATVDQIHRSDFPKIEDRIRLIHKATGIYVSLERAVNTAHWKLDQIVIKSQVS